MTKHQSSDESVIAVTFKDDSRAYEALTLLKELDSQKQIDLRGAAVAARTEDGQIAITDEVDDGYWGGTAGGGLVGLLIGILGGPLGVLIGGATGLLVGSLFDVHDADETESVLSDISMSIRVGHTALLAEVTEPSPEVIDTAMSGLGGSVLRRTLGDVEAEIAAAEKAQRKAKREARKQLLEARRAKHKQGVHAKVEELKAKLRRHKQAAGTAA